MGLLPEAGVLRKRLPKTVSTRKVWKSERTSLSSPKTSTWRFPRFGGRSLGRWLPSCLDHLTNPFPYTTRIIPQCFPNGNSLPVPPLEVEILNLVPLHCEYRSPYATTVRERQWPKRLPDRHHLGSPPLVELRWQWKNGIFHLWKAARCLKVLMVFERNSQGIGTWIHGRFFDQLLARKWHWNMSAAAGAEPNLSPVASWKRLKCPKFVPKPQPCRLSSQRGRICRDPQPQSKLNPNPPQKKQN